MTYHPFKQPRRSIRLRGYDYSQAGAYFVTLCTHNREFLFGKTVANGEMRLNEFGQIVEEEWLRSQDIRQEITLDEWVITLAPHCVRCSAGVPNHLHGIVVITVGAHGDAPNPAHGDAPNPAHGDAPNPAYGGAPNPAHGGAPNPAHGGAPNPAHGGAPNPAHGGAPNPAHGGAPKEADSRPPLQRQPHSLGSFIAGFKSSVTTRINRSRDAAGAPIWQRNYYEHIIRNERELDAIRTYIINNPGNWSADMDNPSNAPKRSRPQTTDDYWRDIGIKL